jgi:hypothetical protein
MQQQQQQLLRIKHSCSGAVLAAAAAEREQQLLKTDVMRKKMESTFPSFVERSPRCVLEYDTIISISQHQKQCHFLYK